MLQLIYVHSRNRKDHYRSSGPAAESIRLNIWSMPLSKNRKKCRLLEKYIWYVCVCECDICSEHLDLFFFFFSSFFRNFLFGWETFSVPFFLGLFSLLSASVPNFPWAVPFSSFCESPVRFWGWCWMCYIMCADPASGRDGRRRTDESRRRRLSADVWTGRQRRIARYSGWW